MDNLQSRVSQLTDRHQERIKNDPNFKALLKRTERTLNLDNSEGVSLHLDTRIEERKASNIAVLAIENTRREALGLNQINKIIDLETEAKNTDLSNDASLVESARILLDEMQINPRLAEL